jgi:serine/threonine protein phosphatase PrpC
LQSRLKVMSLSLSGLPSEEAALQNVFWDVDQSLDEANLPGGTTAVVAYITPRDIVVMNVGDSRCVLVTTDAMPGGKEAKEASEIAASSGGGQSLSDAVVDKVHSVMLSSGAEQLPLPTGPAAAGPGAIQVVDMSEDHRVGLDRERARIEGSGHSIREDRYFDDKGTEHVSHKIMRSTSELGDATTVAMSRSLGDFDFKRQEDLPRNQQAVVPEPDIVHHPRSEGDAYLVLATDGVFDVMTSREVGEFVYVRAAAELSSGPWDAVLPRVADQLLCKCLMRGSQDNMSVVIADLNDITRALSSTQPSSWLDSAGAGVPKAAF